MEIINATLSKNRIKFMLKKILNACYFVFTLTFILSSSIFSGIAPTYATQMGSVSDDDKSVNLVIEEPVNSIEKEIASNEPDLGDDQAFPFIPGFGKNSGKD